MPNSPFLYLAIEYLLVENRMIGMFLLALTSHVAWLDVALWIIEPSPSLNGMSYVFAKTNIATVLFFFDMGGF